MTSSVLQRFIQDESLRTVPVEVRWGFRGTST